MKRCFAFVILGALLSLVSATAASAQTYSNVGAGGIGVSGSLTPGGTVLLTAPGFGDSVVVTFSVHSSPRILGSVTSNSRGVATGQFKLPIDLEPGTHHFEATGLGPDGQLRTVRSGTFVIAGSDRVPVKVAGKSLPRTGSSDSTLPLAATGAAFVVVGAALVTVVRNRRSAATV